MRIVNFLLAIIFLLFAFVQLNDPDPLLWIAIYGVMSVLAVLAIFKMYFPKVMIGLLVAFAAFSMVYLEGVMEWFHQDDKAVIFDDVAKMEYPFIEYSREFLGLWICNAVLIFYLVVSRKK